MNNKGILVAAPIRPVSVSDTFPVAIANEIQGGHHQVNSLVERDAIPSSRRVEGMLVTVVNDTSVSPSTAQTYQLINSAWVLFSSGGSTTPGSQGPQGSQGVTGNQGSQGSQGVTGLTGPQGPQGYQGATGTQGSQGYQGVTGAGVQGPQGVMGRNMTVNAFGSTGVLSNVENSSMQGPWGADFATEYGHVRSYGYVVVDTTLALLYIKQSSTAGDWTTGIPFVPGPQGTAGLNGSQGSQGYQGATGPQGSQGIAGPQGSQGTTGISGYQGPQGLMGPQGNQGSQGYQGTTGARGDSFTVDATSLDGLRSSYINQPAGFTWLDVSQGLLYFKTGTNGVDTWSSSIPFGRGDTGAQGSQGSQGAQGSQGHQGSQGFQGNQGATGITGPQGSQGVTGSQGATGSQGPQGYQGATGVGTQGVRGYQGPQGYQGTAGSGSSSGGINTCVEYAAVSLAGIYTVIKSSSNVSAMTYTATSTTITATLPGDNAFAVNDYVVCRDSSGNVTHGKISNVNAYVITVIKTTTADAFTASGNGYIQAAYGFAHLNTSGGTVLTGTDNTIVGGITYEPSNPMAHGIKMHAISFMTVTRAVGAPRMAPFAAATDVGAYTIQLPFGNYNGIYDDLYYNNAESGAAEYHTMYPLVQSYIIGQAMVVNANQLNPQILPTNRKVMLLTFGAVGNSGSTTAPYVVRMIF